MAWRIEIARAAQKEIDSAGHQTAQRIVRFLFHRLARLDDPRSIGEALQGSRLGEFWKYRVGDHRLIVRIEDETVTILVVRVGHRREVYRG
jgi:mRNA interferase RelE/StbE